ncbi:MAG: hypothetical protein CL912_12030 [Deltaproteobacteria bacterium]|nr:hypothetical protein [Deltaproteobacteria bacterium]
MMIQHKKDEAFDLIVAIRALHTASSGASALASRIDDWENREAKGRYPDRSNREHLPQITSKTKQPNYRINKTSEVSLKTATRDHNSTHSLL